MFGQFSTSLKNAAKHNFSEPEPDSASYYNFDSSGSFGNHD